jgi:flagellar basal body P-ring formation protein FlgA
MIYTEGPLNIMAEGRALDRAGPGELVRVMNLSSRQVVTGLVRGSGMIEVGQ